MAKMSPIKPPMATRRMPYDRCFLTVILTTLNLHYPGREAELAAAEPERSRNDDGVEVLPGPIPGSRLAAGRVANCRTRSSPN